GPLMDRTHVRRIAPYDLHIREILSQPAHQASVKLYAQIRTVIRHRRLQVFRYRTGSDAKLDHDIFRPRLDPVDHSPRKLRRTGRDGPHLGRVLQERLQKFDVFVHQGSASERYAAGAVASVALSVELSELTTGIL